MKPASKLLSFLPQDDQYLRAELEGADSGAVYRFLTQTVVPRPIAWITTIDAEGTVNLAPFSCFTFLTAEPPLLGVSIGSRDGGDKDTLRNVRLREELVVNIPCVSMAALVAGSAEPFPPRVSEAEALGIRLAPGACVAVPRVADIGVALECRLHRLVELGDAQQHCLVVARVVSACVRRDIITPSGIDIDAWQPLARLGAGRFAATGEPFRPGTPKVQDRTSS